MIGVYAVFLILVIIILAVANHFKQKPKPPAETETASSVQSTVEKIEPLQHFTAKDYLKDLPVEFDGEKLRYIYNDISLDNRNCEKNYLAQIYAGSILSFSREENELKFYFIDESDHSYYLGSIFKDQQFYRMICDFLDAGQPVLAWLCNGWDKKVAKIGLAFYQSTKSFGYYKIVRLSGHSRKLEDNAWGTSIGEILSGVYDEERERYEIWSPHNQWQIGFLTKSISKKITGFIDEGEDVKIVLIRTEVEDVSDMVEKERVNTDVLIMIS